MSSRIADTYSSRPNPGMEKMLSMMIVPPIKADMFRPTTVIIPNIDGLRTWRNMIRRSDRPLALAMMTKSSWRVVIRSVRSRRW